MLSSNEIEKKVFDVLRTVCPDVDHTQLTVESTLIEDLGIDSLKIAELSLVLEQAFGCSCFVPDLISREDPYTLTVHHLALFVAENIKHAA